MTSSSLVAPQDITLHLEPPIAGSPPHSISNTMSFVKLSIFGTSFEVNLLSFLSHCSSHSYLSQVTTRYVDLQPVGMGPSFSSLSLSGAFLPLNTGAFGLVWYAFSFPGLVSFRQLYTDAYIVQLCEGSTDRRVRCHKKNHETLQHSRPI